MLTLFMCMVMRIATNFECFTKSIFISILKLAWIEIIYLLGTNVLYLISKELRQAF